MLRLLLYVVSSFVSIGFWVVSFIFAIAGFAFGILSASQVEWNGFIISFIISIVSFALAFCCLKLSKFFDPSFIYYA